MNIRNKLERLHLPILSNQVLQNILPYFTDL
jgi:hypothetical protein